MISVAMCTYNGEQFLKKQLDSICAQTSPVDEIVICDDGSTDHTVELIEAYKKDAKVTIHLIQNEKNLGYKKNFKKAMHLCKGEYIFLCDQDDVWLPTKVESMMDVFQSKEEIRVLASGCQFIDGQDEIIHVDPIPGMSNNNLYTKEVKEGDLVRVEFNEFLSHNYFQGCSLLMDRELRDEVVSHFSDLIHHDWFINVTAAKHDGMYFWNMPLFQYRIYTGNAIGVPTVNRSKWQRLKETNTMEIRTQLSREGLQVLKAIKESDPQYFNKHAEEFNARMDFYRKHTRYLENHQVIKLIKQNKNPYYKELKTRNARIMDILFALEHKS